MANTIYWIDDSVKKLQFIIQGIITDLWDIGEEKGKSVLSRFVVFGNEYQKQSPDYLESIEQEWELERRIKAHFKEVCGKGKEIGEESNLFKDNYYLVNKTAKLLFKQWTDQEGRSLSEIDKDSAFQKRKQELQLFEEIKQFWSTENRNKVLEDKWKIEASQKVTSLIELMDLEKDACVGIDLALLKGDRESIENGDKTVIAMEIYHQLIQERFCFLYSTYTYEKNLVPRCKEIYKKFYNEECRIYRRNELMNKRYCDSVKKDILNA